MDSPFTVIDAIVIVFTFLSTIVAMARGITMEVLRVASLIFAVFLAIYLSDDFSPVINSVVNLHPIADKFASDVSIISGWLAGGVLFIIFWMIFTVITSKISRYIDNSVISGIDSALGFVFGVIRGLFVIGIVYTMYIHFVPPDKYIVSVRQAKTKVILDYTSYMIIGFSELVLPTHISEGFMRKTEKNIQNSPSTTDTSRDIEAEIDKMKNKSLEAIIQDKL